MILSLNRYHWVSFALSFLLFIGYGCKPLTEAQISESEAPMNIQISSTAFANSEMIPAKYTCDAEDVSPQLSWSNVPEETRSLVLIMDDPDAPIGTWVHWVLYELPPDLLELAEGVQGVGIAGNNSWRKSVYGGPCPPPGDPHRYFFKLYALDTKLNLKPGATKAKVERAMQGHIMTQGQLMGQYGR